MVDEEIELDLGLSIGGSFRKPEKLKPVKKVYALTSVDSESNGFDMDVKENRRSLARDGELVDPQAKREMHALRRQEAKRKREEKQEMKRGTCRDKGGEYGSEWGRDGEPARKRERTDEQTQMQMQMQRQHSDVVNAVPFQAVAANVQYPYAPVQHVPLTKGSLGGFPCVMQCWVPGGGRAFEPSTWRGFRPYKGNLSLGFTLSGNGCEKDGANGETVSYGSQICGSSAGSEDRSFSHEGGGSSGDSRSRSCHKANDSKGHSENSASSEPVESDHGDNDNDNHNTNHAKKEEAKPSDSTPGPSKETKMEMGKPPKPQTPNQINTPPLPQMPYVSTTGNGPNGKTVTGFLYRYTKSEVSIVCVCHGSTFSPAEFVQHAGGTDVSHPLRNITVIPSAF